MPFAIINFLYTRPCDSRARTRALTVEFLSIADSLMKIRVTGSTFGTSFGDGFYDLFEENFQKRNMIIIDRTRWEFGYQISGLRTDVRLRMREKRWFR